MSPLHPIYFTNPPHVNVYASLMHGMRYTAVLIVYKVDVKGREKKTSQAKPKTTAAMPSCKSTHLHRHCDQMNGLPHCQLADNCITYKYESYSDCCHLSISNPSSHVNMGWLVSLVSHHVGCCITAYALSGTANASWASSSSRLVSTMPTGDPSLAAGEEWARGRQGKE